MVGVKQLVSRSNQPILMCQLFSSSLVSSSPQYLACTSLFYSLHPLHFNHPLLIAFGQYHSVITSPPFQSSLFGASYQVDPNHDRGALPHTRNHRLLPSVYFGGRLLRAILPNHFRFIRFVALPFPGRDWCSCNRARIGNSGLFVIIGHSSREMNVLPTHLLQAPTLVDTVPSHSVRTVYHLLWAVWICR